MVVHAQTLMSERGEDFEFQANSRYMTRPCLSKLINQSINK